MALRSLSRNSGLISDSNPTGELPVDETGSSDISRSPDPLLTRRSNRRPLTVCETLRWLPPLLRAGVVLMHRELILQPEEVRRTRWRTCAVPARVAGVSGV